MTDIAGPCFPVMEAAYNAASVNGTIPADARAFGYAVRRLSGLGDKLDISAVIDSPAGRCLLDRFMRDNPVLTADWDIVRRERGELIQPDGTEVRLGTIRVRDHIAERDATDVVDLPEELGFALQYPEFGAGDDYGAVLYIEKASFNDLLRQGGILRRYDLGIMSSQGFSVDAARRMLEWLADEHGQQPFIAHDFDLAGLLIGASITNEIPAAIDLGLTWDYVSTLPDLALRSEEDTRNYDFQPQLEELGLDPAAIAFLCQGSRPRKGKDGKPVVDKDGNPKLEWYGRRVELNALVGQEFIDWINAQLAAHDVEKVIPDDDVLEAAYRRAWARKRINDKVDEVWAAVLEEVDDLDIPDDLVSELTEALGNDEVEPRPGARRLIWRGKRKATWRTVLNRRTIGDQAKVDFAAAMGATCS